MLESISIHAPRTGSDVAEALDLYDAGNFNPRSPHGERRRRTMPGGVAIFISIHAPRTGSDGHALFPTDDFRISIHAPRTGSDASSDCARTRRHTISIHAPRTGSDLGQPVREPKRKQFQSTLPARGATARARRSKRPHTEISIHAPRTGSDLCEAHRQYAALYFNPRSPHGERLMITPSRVYHPKFQSTLPARGATESMLTSTSK